MVGAVLIKPAAVKAHHRVRARIVSVILVFAGVFAGTAPCWAHNYFVAHDRVFLSAHSGINFWIGNNPSATGYPRFPPGLRASQAAMLQDSISAAESAAGHRLKRGEVSQFWSAKARNYIRHHFRQVTDDPSHYDLLLNTDRISPEQAVASVLSVMKVQSVGSPI